MKKAYFRFFHTLFLTIVIISVSFSVSFKMIQAEDVNDYDNDGIPDNVDNCPTWANTNQLDSDDDGTGNRCDPTPHPGPDVDNDGIPDMEDNCYFHSNNNQLDSDGDGKGDECDADPYNSEEVLPEQKPKTEPEPEVKQKEEQEPDSKQKTISDQDVSTNVLSETSTDLMIGILGSLIGGGIIALVIYARKKLKQRKIK